MNDLATELNNNTRKSLLNAIGGSSGSFDVVGNGGIGDNEPTHDSDINNRLKQVTVNKICKL